MDADRRAHGVPVLMRLLRMILLYGAEMAWLDDLVLVVRPQHAPFYEQSFACRRIGPARDYPKVHIIGAVAMHLDLHEVRALIRAIAGGQSPANRTQAFLYGADACRPVLAQLDREVRGATLTAEQFDHFFRGHDVLTAASPAERAYVEALYAKSGTSLVTCTGETMNRQGRYGRSPLRARCEPSALDPVKGRAWSRVSSLRRFRGRAHGSVVRMRPGYRLRRTRPAVIAMNATSAPRPTSIRTSAVR